MYQKTIRELREDNDKTQAEIGEVIGVPQSYYSKQELGLKPFKVEQIIQLAKYYNVSADYILGLPRGLQWPR